VLAQILDWYRDPMFWKFPVLTLLISVGAFLIFALPWTLLAWFDPVWARPYRIQDRPFDVYKYLPDTLRRIALNSLIVLGLLVVAWPLLRLSAIHDGPVPPWYVFVGSIVFFLLLDDFLYYWMHRWMHENRWLLKHVHSVHHRIRNPSAIAGNHFHWLELAMTAGLALTGPLLLGSHLMVVWAWMVIRQWEAVDGHTGYDLPIDPGHWLPGYEGSAYHDFHHNRFQGNYAGFLPFWDRVFNTYVPEYLQWRRNRGKRGGLVPDVRP